MTINFYKRIEQIFRMNRRAWRMLICAMVITIGAISTGIAQTIQGIVTDANSGEVINGATILEKNTENNGTTSDFDGKFQLTAQTESPVLMISYVGYQSLEVPYNGEELLEITLSSGLALNEIVVTALGIERE